MCTPKILGPQSRRHFLSWDTSSSHMSYTVFIARINLPKFTVVPHAHAKQFLVSVGQPVPFPAPLAPRPGPFTFTPRVPQPHQRSVTEWTSDSRQTRDTVGVLSHQTVSQSLLSFVLLLKHDLSVVKRSRNRILACNTAVEMVNVIHNI